MHSCTSRKKKEEEDPFIRDGRGGNDNQDRLASFGEKRTDRNCCLTILKQSLFPFQLQLFSFSYEFAPFSFSFPFSFPQQQAIPKRTLDELKRSFMEEYDVNRDGKIEIKEVRTCAAVCIYFMCNARKKYEIPPFRLKRVMVKKREKRCHFRWLRFFFPARHGRPDKQTIICRGWMSDTLCACGASPRLLFFRPRDSLSLSFSDDYAWLYLIKLVIAAGPAPSVGREFFPPLPVQ